MLEKEKILEVKFILPSIEEESKAIFHFCYEKSSGGFDWSESVYKHHPKLKEMVAGIDNKDLFYNKCYEYVDLFRKENQKTIEKSTEDYQKTWGEINKKFIINLLKDFETDYPREIKQIKAKVSINPICPRNIDEWSFNVYYKFNSNVMKQTCIHEIIHFFILKNGWRFFLIVIRKNLMVLTQSGD